MNRSTRGISRRRLLQSGATAVRLLSLPKNTLVEGIAAEDVAVLTTIPGIGPKTAKRVILELRDKVTTRQRRSAVGDRSRHLAHLQCR